MGLGSERETSSPIYSKIPLHPLCLTDDGRHAQQIRPTSNQNAFRHSLTGISQRRVDGVLNPAEQSIREEILSGLLADKGRSGADQHSHALGIQAVGLLFFV